MSSKPRTLSSETRQIAALPWRHGSNGVEIMMITSRETRRWVIPKGNRMAGKTDAEAAVIEAYEEAGVQGDVMGAPIGWFRYGKRLKSGRVQATIASVYPLEVFIQLGAWPEDAQRERRWMSTEDAAAVVDEDELAELIRDFDPGRGTE
ncbi:NUDIX domain [Brevundimonas diminuta]|jgi:8-oxo-dGTP pyrophosphatase MutT (NUDIX family)|uniref:NUDIX hydrolase n=2 Tax=Brevundimonas TaxID=41275 RepID=A0A246KM24_BREDI|nr:MULTISPECIES: NUDIX hydrolase [Brevundimonas]ASD25774.1 NUDIX hydrolase [Brevundimonas diminuta]EGF95036.1 NUDIX domain protein [Brevundimonas diminuta ATCC 11568]MBD3820104.1 NUDIX hydrolase [Brevundimonas diminuta]MBI2248424.1 NUDIX hydrolase [Brevundimonas diminuta]OMG60979.1 NUDIX hydrolase [Brevundimonas sp. ZS04]